MINVHFRSFDYNKDLERLYNYMVKEDNQALFSHNFQILNIPMFEEWISHKFATKEYHDFFIIEDTKGNSIGFTFSYEFFNFDAHCKYTLCLYEEYQDFGLGAIAGVKMIDYLFKRYPLKRIFISIFDYNQKSIDINKKGGFEEVAVLPEYRYMGGEFHSLHILTISREDFYQKHKKIIDKTTV